MLYRVCWQYRDGGKSGHGEPISKELAEAWVEAMNKEYPHIRHWAEPVRETDTKTEAKKDAEGVGQ